MASIRRLPSGSYQAAVLLGKRRTTKAFPTEEEAREWAVEREAERDRARMARKAEDENLPDANKLMVVPPNFVPDWFLDEMEKEQVDGLSEPQKKLVLSSAEFVLDTLVAFMKNNGFVFAAEKPATTP